MNFYSHTYHQLALRLPEALAERVRTGIADGSLEECEFQPESEDSDDRWIFWLNSTERYPARLVNLPCIAESWKTHDNVTYYKSNDIGQVLIVFNSEKEAENADLYSKVPGYEDVHPSGLTPPTTNIVRRRFAKTKKHKQFSKEEVSRVEDIILQILDKPKFDYVFEEVVDFEEYMVSEDHPSGITLGEEDSLLKEHPELLLSNFELTDELKLEKDDGGPIEPPPVITKPKQRKPKQKKRVAKTVSTSKPNTTMEFSSSSNLGLESIPSRKVVKTESLVAMLPQLDSQEQSPSRKDELVEQQDIPPTDAKLQPEIQDAAFETSDAQLDSDFNFDEGDLENLEDYDFNEMEKMMLGDAN